MKNEVIILLAAFDGSAYIREQIDSILCQDFEDWHLILSDDGDKTSDILKEYAEKHPDKITHHISGRRFGSAEDHFSYLLQNFHDAPYIMFSDQDDVWHKDKVRKTLALMKETEGGEKEIPVLVHTDLRVVDRDLKERAPSFMAFQDLDGTRLKINQLLMQNVVTGCTMMINHSLAELFSKRVPELGMLMHDWWLALLASAFGKAAFLNEATIDYRQHGDNSVGAKNVKSAEYAVQKVKSGSVTKTFTDNVEQAEAFQKCFAEYRKKAPQAFEVVDAFVGLSSKSKLGRIRIYKKYKLWKKGLKRIAAQLLFW